MKKRHRLLSGDDVFYVRNIAVQSGNDGVTAGVICDQGIGNSQGGAVVRTEHGIERRSVAIKCRKKCIHSVLGKLGSPPDCRDLVKFGLPGFHDDPAICDIRIKNIHRTVIKEIRLVI